jgi:hypothetical protein
MRMDARLDAATLATLADLTAQFRRSRGAVLRQVLRWGLVPTQEWTVAPCIPTRPPLVRILVELPWLQEVQEATVTHGVTMAAWLRYAMHQVTHKDFPLSWQAAETAPRSHGSRSYHRPFRLRLDDETSTKLAILTQTFNRSAAEVIRQLIMQARPEDFPQSWYLARDERRQGEPS